MSETVLDDVDREILTTLQRDARNATTREIGEEIGVSASTVSNRTDQLEDDGIITGYRATLDFAKAGYPLVVLVICTAPIVDREDLARRALDVPGVVNVRELMVGEGNIRVKVVGESNDDITRAVTALSEMGLTVSDEILVRDEFVQPLSFLGDETESDMG